MRNPSGMTMAALVRYDAGLDDALPRSAEGGAEEGRPDIAKQKLKRCWLWGTGSFRRLDEAASPRDGGSGLGGLCGLGGGRPSKDSGVIPWDFRPLWLDFFGPHSRKGITMSELSNRMIRDMQLAGLVEGTRREYVRGVRQLSAYYMVSPDQLSERNVEDYILYVRDDLGVAKGTFAPMFAGLKFFYLNTLGYDWPLFTKKKSAGHAGSGCPTSAVTRTAAA